MKSRPSATKLLTVAAIITFLLLIPLPAMRHAPLHALRAAVEDTCHPLAFAVLATLLRNFLNARLPSQAGWRTGAITLVACVLAGAGSEWLQIYTGRDSSWSDFVGDASGSFFALCGAAALKLRKQRHDKVKALAAGIAATIAAAIALAPLVIVVAAYSLRVAGAPVFWRSDSYLLQRFSTTTDGRYPGLILEELPADWRGYRYLVIDVTNNDAASRGLHVRVHDISHDNSYADRFNTILQLPPGASRHRINLSEVFAAPRHRVMQMEHIAGVVLFVIRPETMDSLHVDQLALEP
jgi:VanZ family protein